MSYQDNPNLPCFVKNVQRSIGTPMNRVKECGPFVPCHVHSMLIEWPSLLQARRQESDKSMHQMHTLESKMHLPKLE